MTPEDISMIINEIHLGGNCYTLSKSIVKTLLKFIKNGEVVELAFYHQLTRYKEVVLKPDFEKFLKGE